MILKEGLSLRSIFGVWEVIGVERGRSFRILNKQILELVTGFFNRKLRERKECKTIFNLTGFKTSILKCLKRGREWGEGALNNVFREKTDNFYLLC